jgi:hypothetical protein
MAVRISAMDFIGACEAITAAAAARRALTAAALALHGAFKVTRPAVIATTVATQKCKHDESHGHGTRSVDVPKHCPDAGRGLGAESLFVARCEAIVV